MIISVGNIESKLIVEDKDLKHGNVIKKLRSVMRERRQGYGHTTSYKEHKWDGWSYFITKVGRSFGTGLLPLVTMYLYRLGVDYTINDKRINLPTFKDTITEVIGDGITARDYQVHMVNKIKRYVSGIYFPRGIIKAAVNAGKTYTIASLYRNIKNPKLVFIVDRVELYVQTVLFFESIGIDVGEVKGVFKHDVKRFRKAKTNFTNFTVVMVATLSSRLKGKNKIAIKKALSDVNILVVDESHKAISNTYKKVIVSINAGMRIFMSGSPFDSGDKVDKVHLIAMSGTVIGEIKNKFLVEEGVSRKVVVNIILNHTRSRIPLLSYRVEKEELIYFSDVRNSIIADIVTKKEKGKYILITYNELAHGMAIYDKIRSIDGFEESIEIVHGSDDDRSGKVDRFLNKQTKILLSSSILREGINMKFIQVMIKTQGGMSGVDVRQWAGRGQRDNNIDDRLILYDFYDVGKHISKHSNKRIKYYKEEDFDIVFHYDKTKVRGLSNKIKF